MNNLERFRTLGVSECVIAALQRKGFESPTPIQELTIPLLLKGEKDVIGQAQTGTGKTAAFGIPVIDTISRGEGAPQALILAPTRELSIQIAEELNSLQGASRLRIAPFYGGQNILVQLDRLRDGMDIVIGTPGRIIDLMERGKLNFDHLKFAVLDEADEMLDMGFVDDIRKILSATPPDKRMLMFSATMPEEILSIAEEFMRPDYEIIRTKTESVSTDLTEQICYEVRRENKLEALSRILDMEPELYGMVFCRTKNDVDELTDHLLARGYAVDALHGDIAQTQRTRVINNFKARRFRVLIATDVAARGIDVNDLTHVINYSLPQSTEAYVHRIGRTGRAGKKGTAITFVTPSELGKLGRIRRGIHAEIRKKTLPGIQEVLEAKKQRFSEKLRRMIDEREHCPYLGFAEELLTLADHPAELLAAMLRLRFRNELLPESYVDLEQQPPKTGPERKGHARIRVAAGRDDGITVPQLLEMIFQKTGIKGSRLGRIDLKNDCSYLNANAGDADRIVKAFQGAAPEFTLVPGEEFRISARLPDTVANRQNREEAHRGRCREPRVPPADSGMDCWSVFGGNWTGRNLLLWSRIRRTGRNSAKNPQASFHSGKTPVERGSEFPFFLNADAGDADRIVKAFQGAAPEFSEGVSGSGSGIHTGARRGGFSAFQRDCRTPSQTGKTGKRRIEGDAVSLAFRPRIPGRSAGASSAGTGREGIFSSGAAYAGPEEIPQKIR